VDITLLLYLQSIKVSEVVSSFIQNIFLLRYTKEDRQLAAFLFRLFGFYPKNIHLFKLAFHHRSIMGKNNLGIEYNNERLEYLGDSILGSVVAEYLYRKYPKEREGFLTQMRSRIVSRQSLNALGKKMGLMVHINADWSSMRNSSAIGDAFEALMGAVYLDKGFDATKEIVIKRILDWHINLKEIEENDTDFKSQFINRMQKEKRVFEFLTVEEKVVGKQKEYLLELKLDGESVAQFQHHSKRFAEQQLSRMGLERIN
jgi:ribonuclease III